MMKPQKGFDWFKLVTTAMFVIGGAGILFYLIASLTVFNEEPQTIKAVVNSDKPTEDTLSERVSRSAKAVEPIQQAGSGESKSATYESVDARMEEWDASLAETDDFEDTTKPTISPSQVGVQEERFYGLTRAEIKAKILILEEEIRDALTQAVDLYLELKSTDEIGAEPEVAKWRKDTWQEVLSLWRKTFDNTLWYKRYLLVIDADGYRANNPFAEGGWIYELSKPLPMRIDDVN